MTEGRHSRTQEYEMGPIHFKEVLVTFRDNDLLEDEQGKWKMMNQEESRLITCLKRRYLS